MEGETSDFGHGNEQDKNSNSSDPSSIESLAPYCGGAFCFRALDGACSFVESPFIRCNDEVSSKIIFKHHVISFFGSRLLAISGITLLFKQPELRDPLYRRLQFLAAPKPVGVFAAASNGNTSGKFKLGSVWLNVLEPNKRGAQCTINFHALSISPPIMMLYCSEKRHSEIDGLLDDDETTLICPVLSCQSKRPIPDLWTSTLQTHCHAKDNQNSNDNNHLHQTCTNRRETCLESKHCPGVSDLRSAIENAAVSL